MMMMGLENQMDTSQPLERVWNEVDDPLSSSSSSSSSSLPPFSLWMWNSKGKKETKENVYPTDLLFLAFGKESIQFTNNYYLERDVLATILTSSDSFKGNKFERSSSDLSTIVSRVSLSGSSQSFILIECGQKIPIEQSFHFMECVFAHIHPKRVVSLSFQQKKLFQIEEKIEKRQFGFVRTLVTQKAIQNSWGAHWSFLETSNVVDDHIATLLTFCQIHEIEAAAILSFPFSDGRESFSPSPFLFVEKVVRGFEGLDNGDMIGREGIRELTQSPSNELYI